MVKVLALLVLLGPTIWALTDVLRRQEFSARRKAGWAVALLVGGMTMLAFMVPFVYAVAVKFKRTHSHEPHGRALSFRRERGA